MSDTAAEKLPPWHAAVLDIVPTQLRQTVRHDPPHTYGDCFRTTIACLLGLDDPTVVPHFVAANIDDGDHRGWMDIHDAREWLRAEHDLDLFPMVRADADEMGVHYKTTVQSPLGVLHSVVACGGRVVWCPAGHPVEGMQVIENESAWVVARPWAPDPDGMVSHWREMAAIRGGDDAGS